MMRASAKSRQLLQSSAGEGCGPLPTCMDDWTKLDYYRFCLFQKQVQEEFQRENRQLRSRLQLKAFPSRPNMKETQEPPEPTGPVYPFEGNDIIAASLSLQSLEDKAADALSKSAETEKCKAAYEAALRAEEIAFAEAEAAWAAEEEFERAAEAAAVKKRRRGGC
ncbi:unnamed protein product [Cladocopium goreaui]|uniref:Uncharacterized protein n=1 Tax=Cladocopium goreaui TaxID=2562237 RepID=A0A9P1D3K7_9DINO|nr:unnamed protein product [Cladocopium goreaui]|mmetsp:Transcript_12861/g.28352  ORF Transcript_12861/g.28352 Transcript_12861/m.28352 type:complete len:165 (-) Transcript_12861:157-651(-)